MSQMAVIALIMHREKTYEKLLEATSNLKSKRLVRIENIDDEHYKVKVVSQWNDSFIAMLALFISGLIFFFFLLFSSWTTSAMSAIVAFLAINLGRWTYDSLSVAFDPLIQKIKPLVLQKETFVAITCKQCDLGKFIDAIQKIQEEPLAFYIFSKEEKIEQIRSKELLPQTPEANDEIQRQAQALARMHTPASNKENYSGEFLQHIHYIANKYQTIYEKLYDYSLYNENIHLSAEWLLDNAYNIRQTIKDIDTNLPKEFFQQLPFFESGSYQGVPAIYPLASRLVALTDGKVTNENIVLFLQSYQSQSSLTMAELWAFPLILKIRLLECLVSITNTILDRVRQNQLASFWANRILSALKKEPEKLYSFLAVLAKDVPQPSINFADQLLVQIGDFESANSLIKNWLKRKIGDELPEIFQFDQLQQTLEQTSLANVITSLHRLAQINWQEVFVRVCTVEKILSEEALGVYGKMDFNTRDRYRHVVEKLARKKKISEEFVAKQAVELTQNKNTPYEQHVGYYLIDNGKSYLKNAIGLMDSWYEKIIEFLKRHNTTVYFSIIAFFTALIVIGLYLLTNISGSQSYLTWILIALSILPASEVVIQFVNYLLAQSLKPNILPKMHYKEDIPKEFKTLIVVPTLLISKTTIHKDLERLEIHYLANNQQYLNFALITDYKDADQQHAEQDDVLLKEAMDGIKALNEKYHCSKFFLFHRKRTWNPCENCWMGWERKRGKLERLNCFLSGDTSAELNDFLHAGSAADLLDTRFVLTADCDTQLPKDSVRELIETLSHPLNIAYIDLENRSLLRGYTILQPRVSTSYISKNATWFTKIFSDPSGVDPYSKSVSDIYQDIFNEGVYHGKGLYDYKAFNKILSQRFPDNQILSHDLIEGSYVKTAFASDIELYDSFPSTYLQYIKRQHRWVRGDWQVLPWMFGTVKDAKGNKEKNPLSFINRWKILDNLKRSLLPPISLLILLVGWLTSGTYQWTLFIVGVNVFPNILQTVDWLRNNIFSRLSVNWWDIGKTLLKAILQLSLLPHLAWINVDAISRAIYRQFFSRKDLLKWEVSSIAEEKKDHWYQARQYIISILAVIYAFFLGGYFPYAFWLAMPLLLLWMISPLINKLLDSACESKAAMALSHSSEKYLRILARKTWRYFDDFVTAEVNWLPPDNYQEKLRIEIANRTSPTNIGFYLMSIISAYRFGWMTISECTSRMRNLIDSIKKLETYEGHLLNWYDIKTLEPLYPKYVSTVDSGNLLAAFWCGEEICKELLSSPVIDTSNILSGIQDIIFILNENNRHHHFEKELKVLKENLSDNIKFLAALKLLSQSVEDVVDKKQVHTQTNAIAYWIIKLKEQLQTILSWIDSCIPWFDLFNDPAAQKIILMHPQGVQWKIQAGLHIPTLTELANRNIPGIIPFLGWLQTLSIEKLDSDQQAWIGSFINKINGAINTADNQFNAINVLMLDFQQISAEKNMKFLYVEDRKLFSIGYNVSEKRMDSSCYDLLASEARLASFVSIASGEVPLDHWWALGRPLGEDFGEIVLLSWGGTMFEYLMPVIWCKNYQDTLLDYACKEAVKCQVIYGNQRGIPWGISESAYSRLDVHNIYQYRAFGVPFLGIKRGLDKDLVTTPYSSALALMIDPQTAIKNLKRLDYTEGMNGDYGMYEAIDYSREFEKGRKRGIIVHTFMVHHLGMTLGAICNCVMNGYLQELFHSHPRVKATETLLCERPMIPSFKAMGRPKERKFTKIVTTSSMQNSGHLDTAMTPIPVTHLLSNGNYSVMITNSGSGYSHFQDIDITRWHMDPTCDNWGSYLYIKDLENFSVLSAAFQPMRKFSTHYAVNYTNHSAEIIKKESGLDIHTEIVVSPEDNVEIRLVTLSSNVLRHRRLELTSYVEIALAPHRADSAHPAFSKMFIETQECLPQGALLAHRRLRSAEEKEYWMFHFVAMNEENSDFMFAYETSRENFIGRNRTLANPKALESDLTNSSGFVLDPIFSIRNAIEVPLGKKIKISYITGYAASKEEAIKLIEKYKYLEASKRTIEMSWTHSELNLRRLHITHQEAKLYQHLANFMIFSDNKFRASQDQIRRNRFGQENLWAYGISGDYPILLATVLDSYEMDVIQELLQAHAFWHMRGFKADLVIINQEDAGYEMPLHDHLARAIQNFSQFYADKNGGKVYLLQESSIAHEDLNLLYTVAHVVIIAGRGSLTQQFASPRITTPAMPLLGVSDHFPEEPSSPLPFWELDFFNGIGGFTKDAKEYAIYLGKEKATTPAPWINVIANRNFGFMASEQGLGMTWSINSQMNRLTPWSNDPTIDPIADVCYVRDDESGKFWSITPSPILENDPFRARHGQGYTVYEHNSHAIDQEMTVFTPVQEDASIRIQVVRLTNRSSRKRKLSIYGYVELTLGQQREDSLRYIVTNWNIESNSLMAFNRYRNNFCDRVAFFSCSQFPVSYTCNRKEFIGRNGALNTPEALRKTQLSKSIGTAMDPCFALHTTVELFCGESTEVVFLLGEGPHVIKAKEIIKKYQNIEFVHESLRKTREWWDSLLATIQIQTPDKSLDIVFNRWLIYQTLSCRIWARSAFYQSGGAIGFRDQLQDAAAIVYFNPNKTRAHLLLCASRQFLEGDVQHWWHPDSGSGVRTRICDDLLWLPYVALHYMRVTGDNAIMDAAVPYLEGRLLESTEHEAFIPAARSEEEGSLKEHCIRAIDRSLHLGPHQLPLIGGGDWNDGMNLVGKDGRGESVWLAWFLIYILNDFVSWLHANDDHVLAERYTEASQSLLRAIEENAWDGDWYIRAFFDDGTPIGSHVCEEDKIDSLPQTWSVIAGQHGDRSDEAMKSVDSHLVDTQNKLVLLYTPPYNKTSADPGYIKGYPPGVRENGGQYTHAAVWVAMAFLKKGDGNKGMQILHMLNPINHSSSPEDSGKYRVEPYVTVADIYKLEGQIGRGGWSWYTGSASLMYRTILEDLCGFKLKGEHLELSPCIPHDWEGFSLTYRHGEGIYYINIENPSKVCSGVRTVTLDGQNIDDVKNILLSRIPAEHHIKVILG